MVFIRAPKVVSVGEGVQVLGKCRKECVIVQQGKVIATAFHPEIDKINEVSGILSVATATMSITATKCVWHRESLGNQTSNQATTLRRP